MSKLALVWQSEDQELYVELVMGKGVGGKIQGPWRYVRMVELCCSGGLLGVVGHPLVDGRIGDSVCPGEAWREHQEDMGRS